MIPPYKFKKALICFLSIFVLLYSGKGFSQCTINYNQVPMFADPQESYDVQIINGNIVSGELSTGYDTLTAFPTVIDATWDAVIGLRVPIDTSIVYDAGNGTDPAIFEGAQINNIGINSVIVTESTNGMTILPSGFSWDCVGGDGSSNCNWAGGDYGCIRFGFDSPIAPGYAGAYRLTVKLDVSATYSFAGIPIPIELVEETLLNYYVLVISDEQNASFSEIINVREFSLIGTFPNPANDNFTVQYGNRSSEDISVKLYDILGNVLLNESHESMPGYNEVQFDASNLSSGIYTVSVSNSAQQMIKRIVIE